MSHYRHAPAFPHQGDGSLYVQVFPLNIIFNQVPLKCLARIRNDAKPHHLTRKMRPGENPFGRSFHILKFQGPSILFRDPPVYPFNQLEHAFFPRFGHCFYPIFKFGIEGFVILKIGQQMNIKIMKLYRDFYAGEGGNSGFLRRLKEFWNALESIVVGQG